MKMKKILSLIIASALLLPVIGGCNSADEDENPSSNNSSEVVDMSSYPETSQVKADKAGYQLEAPAAGEEIAVLHTNKGDIKIRLFPEYAPKAVENFKGLINKGYYNGIVFHRVINDFMIQGGDPTATGTGGESIYGKAFEDEFTPNLINLRGSLSMANSGKNTNGSQFFINQKGPDGQTAADLRSYYEAYKTAQYLPQYTTYYNYLKSMYDSDSRYSQYYPDFNDFFQAQYPLTPDIDMVPDNVLELYAKYGGNINLDGAFRLSGGHTVFGQVFEGLETVDAIAGVEVDDNNKPIEDVVIESAEIVKYQ